MQDITGVAPSCFMPTEKQNVGQNEKVTNMNISFGLVRKRAHHVAKMLNVYAPTYCKQPTGCMGQLEWQWYEIKL